MRTSLGRSLAALALSMVVLAACGSGAPGAPGGQATPAPTPSPAPTAEATPTNSPGTDGEKKDDYDYGDDDGY